MAAGGVVFTGPTGEAYSVDGAGAISLDTADPSELVLIIENLCSHPERTQAIRQIAPFMAARYTWENVLEILFEKILMAADRQKTHPIPSTNLDLQEPIQYEVIFPFLQTSVSQKEPDWSMSLENRPFRITPTPVPG
jgi:hypothetical protein